MNTVVRRIVRSSPHRDSAGTWIAIVDLLTQGKQGAVRDELMSVAGVASAIITERAPAGAAIVTTCDGPRTRIYCLYDEDAIEGSDAKEEPLGYEPLNGDWAVSLPCAEDDLVWVQRALKAKSNRVTAREQSAKLGDNGDTVKKAQSMSIDIETFLKS